MGRLGFVYDMTACVGCGACQTVCQDQHDLPAEVALRRFGYVEDDRAHSGHFPYTGACHHCLRPACAGACPTGALRRGADGVVLLDEAACVGCGACVSACPYGAVTLEPARGVAVKCDACADRRAQGLDPACVAGCVTRCLRFGELEEAPANAVADLPNLPDSALTDPSLRVLPYPALGKGPANAAKSPSPPPAKARYEPAQPPASAPWESGPEAMAARRLTCHLLALFFCDRAGWKAQAGLLDVIPDLSDDEYGWLFQGCDASVRVPLWASVCKGPGRVYLGPTTLEMIRHCKARGYQPQRVDGNPPDYIGEQLRYLEYLAVCGLAEDFRGFVEAFARPTAERMAEALREHTRSPEVTALLDRLDELLSGNARPLTAPQREALDALPPVTQNPPLPLAAPRVVHSSGVNNCGGRCCIDVVEQEGCVLFLDSRPEADGPVVPSCPRGKAYRHTFLNTDRLRYPMKRVGKRGEGKFRRISWAEAVETIAGETRRLRGAYGPGALHCLYGTGNTAVMNPKPMMNRLLFLDGGALGSYNSYSSACVSYTTPYIYGDNQAGSSEDNVLHTNYLILWGNNPTETQYGTARNRYIQQRRAEGLHVVVIDPRCSDTAVTLADEWIPIRPSTDGAMADAMAWVIWSEGLQDQQFMDRYCIGFDEAHMPEGIPPEECVRAYLFGERDGVPKTPEWAEAITGVPAQTIRRIARDYANAKPGYLLPGLGVQRIGNGEQTTRSLAMLACLTGNVGVPGGGAAASVGFAAHKIPGFPVPPNPYPGLIPCFLWFKAVDRGCEMDPAEDGLKGVERLDSPIKALFCMGSNTLINQHSNINETMEILSDESKCEFIALTDVFMTPSARWADLVLPAASVFESENISKPWYMEADHLLPVTPAIEPLFACRPEYDWLVELSRHWGLEAEFTEGRATVGEWLEHLYNQTRNKEPELPDYETFRAKGGYHYKEHREFVAYWENIRDGKPFNTPSGKIEIFSERLYRMNNPEEIPGIPRYTPCVEGPQDKLRARYPLQLVGYHTKRRTHSVHDNNELLDQVDPPELWISPRDAEARGIAHGGLVEVFNDRGRVRIPAKVTTRMMPGVVAMSQGGWFTPDSEGTDTRGSINTLTLTHKPTPLAKGNPQHTNLVEVALCPDREKHA